jgi:hypothetical protein
MSTFRTAWQVNAQTPSGRRKYDKIDTTLTSDKSIRMMCKMSILKPGVRLEDLPLSIARRAQRKQNIRDSTCVGEKGETKKQNVVRVDPPRHISAPPELSNFVLC